MAKKGGLGRGQEAQITDNAAGTQGAVELRISEIEPNRSQPRHDFDQQALEELSDSIAKHGVLQPLLVRPLASGGYQIVAGERRWRASRMAGLTTVPAVIREMNDRETMEAALIENLQREDLNPVEEAKGYKALMEGFGLSQEEVAGRVGRSRPAVANALRLLALPEELLKLVQGGAISAGHGRALLAISDPAAQKEAARAAAAGASVRELERMAKQRPKSSPPSRKPGASYYKEVELTLAEALGRKVRVTQRDEKGTLSLDFYSRDDLAELVRVFMREE